MINLNKKVELDGKKLLKEFIHEVVEVIHSPEGLDDVTGQVLFQRKRAEMCREEIHALAEALIETGWFLKHFGDHVTVEQFVTTHPNYAPDYVMQGIDAIMYEYEERTLRSSVYRDVKQRVEVEFNIAVNRSNTIHYSGIDESDFGGNPYDNYVEQMQAIKKLIDIQIRRAGEFKRHKCQYDDGICINCGRDGNA